LVNLLIPPQHNEKHDDKWATFLTMMQNQQQQAMMMQERSMQQQQQQFMMMFASFLNGNQSQNRIADGATCDGTLCNKQ